jgi:hypothetical protein
VFPIMYGQVYRVEMTYVMCFLWGTDKSIELSFEPKTGRRIMSRIGIVMLIYHGRKPIDFFLNFPLYLLSVRVNSANAVTSCRRELTGTLLYSIGSESSCD